MPARQVRWKTASDRPASRTIDRARRRSAGHRDGRGGPGPLGHYAGLVIGNRLLGDIAGFPTAIVVFDTAMGVLCAVLGYRLSEADKRSKGTTPWRVPSPVWAILIFLSWLIGGLLFLIARATTRPRTLPGGWSSPSDGPYDTQVPPGGWAPPTGGAAFPRYPEPSHSPSPGPATRRPGDEEPAPPGPGGSPGAGAPPGARVAPGAPAPPLPPRAWLADPRRRHELRYWDGTVWTEHVSDGGKISTDPL